MASRLRRRAVIVPAIGVLVIGGGAVAWAQSGSGGGGYRTAVVRKGEVQQLLTKTGTVAVVDSAKAHFRASGTVGSVNVTVGQTVTKGQVLATMDAGSLADVVTKARATLATAKATLETDSASSSSSSSTPTATPSPSASAPTRGGGGGGSLTQAQQAAERALKQATHALTAATVACATPVTPTSTPGATLTPSVTATTTPTGTTTPAATAAPRGPRTLPVLSCADALQASLKAQQQAGRAQQSLAQALAKASTSSSAATAPSSTASSSSPQRSSSGGGGGGGFTSTAAKITTDTAAVAAAQVALGEAEKDLAAVSLIAPISGTVAILPWTPGSPTSPTDSAVLLGTGSVEVTVEVPAASIRTVRVGLPATVRGDGATKPVSGVVTRIGLLPTSSTSSTPSTTTYPVVVKVPAGPGLVDGGAAAVSIAVKSVSDVVTVPNSALHNGRVTVLLKGKASSVRVTTGVTGALTTEVTKGLNAGQTVVLADLSEALPTSSTTSNRNSFGGNGGFGGTGGAGFGPPGGGQLTVRGG